MTDTDTENPGAWTPDQEQRALFKRVQAEKEDLQNDLLVRDETIRDQAAEIKDLKAKLTKMAREKGLDTKDNERRAAGIARLIEVIAALQHHIARQNTFEILLQINQAANCHLCTGKARQHIAGCPLNKLSPFQTKVFAFSTFDTDFDDDEEVD